WAPRCGPRHPHKEESPPEERALSAMESRGEPRYVCGADGQPAVLLDGLPLEPTGGRKVGRLPRSCPCRMEGVAREAAINSLERGRVAILAGTHREWTYVLALVTETPRHPGRGCELFVRIGYGTMA